MTNEKLYELIGDIKEEYIQEAKRPQKRTSYLWLKFISAAACLCLVLVTCSHFLSGNLSDGSNGCGFFGNGDSEILASHRDDFTLEIEPAILAQFEDPAEVKKAYWLLSNEWFLSNELTDFSQAVTTDAYYIAWCDENGIYSDTAYSCYEVNETGSLEWGYTAYMPSDSSIPCEFWKLTYEMIDTALSDITYEDYIITYSPRLGTVFVWVRSSEKDVILTYPSRPDLLGIECGEIYTLNELQEILTEAYEQ